MQLISAAKMRRAQNAVLASRDYAGLLWEAVGELSQQTESKLPLLESHPKAEKILIALVATNRGQVGGLNSGLVHALRQVANSNPGLTPELVTFGRKAAPLGARLRWTVAADFEKPERGRSASDVYPLVSYLVKRYESGDYRKVVVIYSHFHSTLSQKPASRTVLPLNETLLVRRRERGPGSGRSRSADSYLLFEPSPERVLEQLLPRIVESQVFQAILEADASEHSARMIMMKNATEAAGDLIASFTLTYNQLRQNKITTELAEITAGRIALE